MKKVLSVILTMAMLLSMFSCLFTTGAAAETSNSVVIQDFETGFTQASGATSVSRDPDNIEENDKPIWSCTVKNDDTTYLNIGGIEGGKNIHYLTNIAETGMLSTDGTKYNLTFKYRIHKGTATATNQAVKFTLQTQTASTSLGFVERSHNADYETEWRTATIENITPVANDLYTKLRLEGGAGTAGMTVDIDDCVFTKAVTASATANGIGTAKVNNTKPVYGSVMTYTAKTANTFLGWFDGVNPDPVSTNEVYTFTYNGTQPVALTAKFEGKTVVQDFETGFTQSTTTSVLRDPDNIEENDKPIWSCTVKNDDTTYLNIGDIAGGKSIHYLTNIAETGMLSTDGTKYNLTFKYRIHKGTATATNQAVKFTLQTQTAGTSLGFVEKSYNADYETEWRTATIENITPVANDLYTKLRLEGGSGTKDAVKGMTVDIDDCVFTEVVPAVSTSVTVEGKLGTASVDKAEIVKGNTVTYTATEYLADAFLGWYNGETLVSADKVYTFAYDGTQALDLTAKFRTDIIAQTFETGWVVSSGTSSTIARNPDNKTSKNTYALVETENGNKYLKITIGNDGSWLHYAINEKETGLLDTEDTLYSVTFKYKVLTETDKEIRVFFWGQNDDGTTNQDWNTITFNGGTRATGVKLNYTAEAAGTWQTATVNNVITDGYTTGRLAALVTNAPGVQFAIDDIVFTEYVPQEEPAVSTSVTVEGTTGTATVDKEEVKNGDTVTYTATENIAGAFLGWYNGETLVSADKVYTFTYTGAEALALTAKFAAAYNTSVTVDGKLGTATVDKAQVVKGNTVTYTATEYLADAFLGWYNGETLVSADKTYTFTYTGEEALALTAKFISESIAQTFETGFTQASGATSVSRDPDNIEENDKPIWSCTVKNDDTTYLNIGGIEGGKNIHYLTNIAETGMLDATKTYTLTFKYRIHKGTATATNQAVKFTLQTQTASTSLGFVERSHNADYETEWRTATIENITPVANDLYTKLRLEGGAGTAGMTVDIDDCVFTEVIPTFATKVTVDGKFGTATVDKEEVAEGEAVTYTATEYLAGAFAGWYNGEVLVSADKTYTFTYTGEEALALTAKFISESIAQTFETGWVVSSGTSSTIARNPDNKINKNTYGTIETENGNKYLKITIGENGSWLHYVINDKETGLLNTDASVRYNLTFKYKILTATEKTVNVFFWGQNDDGDTNKDWESITDNGGVGATGVKLIYDAENANTWQTATIYNVKKDNYTTGRLAAHITNATGVQFAIDDVIFTETFIANASANGAGNAQVSKRYVEKGDTVTFTATANDNGEFVAWLDDEGNEVSTDATYTVANFDGTQVINLTAKFKTLVSASATVDNPENGGATCVVEGDTVTFTATETRENSFIGWFDAEGNFVDGKATFTVEINGAEEISYIAKFKNADGSFDEDAFDKAFNAQYVKFEGTAMRAQTAEKPQALRFKTTIKYRDLLAENGFIGLQIVEYGTLIGNTKKLAGAELTHATEGHLIGVAYNSADGTDIIFENNNGDIQFTAALTGIKAKDYDKRFTMRAYVIVTDGVNNYTVYADEYEYSVYDVMYAIKRANKENDVKIVDAILDADVEIRTKYEEYVATYFPTPVA